MFILLRCCEILIWVTAGTFFFSFVKVSRPSSQHETRCIVSCSVRASENTSHRIQASREHIIPASKDHVVKAIGAINGGQVIAVPTDTIYGFACDAWLVFLISLLVLPALVCFFHSFKYCFHIDTTISIYCSDAM